MSDCAPTRDRLPDRRMQISDKVEWQGQEWMLSVGFDRAGRVREAFVKGYKTGSAMDAIMDDACVLLSLLLQAGYSAAALESHLGREGVDPSAPAASPLGLLTQVAAGIERETGDGVRAAHDFLSLNLAGRVASQTGADQSDDAVPPGASSGEVAE